MSYVACANCGNLNRQSDTHCYSCGQELVAVAPPPPPVEEAPSEDDPWAANRDLRVQPLSVASGGDPSKARFKDLASRYEARPVEKIDANIVHGVRAALPAALLTGPLMALYRKQQPDELTRLVVKKYPKMPKQGSEMMGYSLCFELFFALLLGCILGLTNILCFTPESGRTGAVIGALVSAVMIYLAGLSYGGIVIGAVHGFVLGTLASLIERKLFRRKPS
jgi:hypothetical protein